MKQTIDLIWKISRITFPLIFVIDLLLRFVVRDSIYCIQNDGIAFGISIFNEEFVEFLMLLILLIFIMLTFWKGKLFQPSYRYFPFVWLFGVINFVDRMIYGSICDYVFLPIIKIHFNLADFAITLIILIVIFIEFTKTDGNNYNE